MIEVLAVFALIGFVILTAYIITENNDINEKIKEVDEWIKENFKK